jgi:hypothetical protein
MWFSFTCDSFHAKFIILKNSRYKEIIFLGSYRNIDPFAKIHFGS